MDVYALWNDVLDLGREGAENGKCACVVFEHVTDNGNYLETQHEMLDTLALILAMSEQGATDANVAHFLTAVMAVGYALGASAAYDTSINSDVSVPDSLAGLELLEPRPGDRPAQD